MRTVVQRCSVRRANPADARGIRDAHVASIRGLCSSHYSADVISVWSKPRGPGRYRKAMETGEVYFVALVDSRVRGFASWKDDVLCAVYVHPAYAGLGLGKRLLRRAERDACSKGVRRFRMDASLNALPFYRSHGYRVSRYASHRMGNGMQMPCVKMSKKLDRGERKNEALLVR